MVAVGVAIHQAPTISHRNDCRCPAPLSAPDSENWSQIDFSTKSFRYELTSGKPSVRDRAVVRRLFRSSTTRFRVSEQKPEETVSR